MLKTSTRDKPSRTKETMIMRILRLTVISRITKAKSSIKTIKVTRTSIRTASNSKTLTTTQKKTQTCYPQRIFARN